MAISAGILFAIIAMIAWGTADFFAAKAVRKTNVFRAFVWSQVIGLILFLLIYAFFFDFPSISVFTLSLILASSLLIIIAGMSFYKGLQVGYVSIISPVSSMGAVIAVLLSLIFLNESLNKIQTIGIILAIFGTILTSFKLKDILKLKLNNFATGIQYAIITMFGWGILLILIDLLVTELGWFLPIFFIKAVVVFYVLMYSGFTKKSISFPRNVSIFLILTGTLEAGAFLFFGLALTTENTSIVAPIINAFPIIAIILARIFFKEILEINQKFGVFSVIAGIVLLSL